MVSVLEDQVLRSIELFEHAVVRAERMVADLAGLTDAESLAKFNYYDGLSHAYRATVTVLYGDIAVAKSLDKLIETE